MARNNSLAHLAIFILVSVLCGSCVLNGPPQQEPTGQTTPKTSAVPTVTWSPNSGIDVANRAPIPTDVSAPGIQILPPNRLPIGIGNETYEIPANDWNTITADSAVPRDVTLILDPEFHASPVTRNRFQYLADIIYKHSKAGFVMYGIAAVLDGGDVVSIVAIVNPATFAVKLTRLDLTVRVSPPETTLTRGTFYSAAGRSVSIGPKSVYFARLTSPLIKNVANSRTTTFNFHFETIKCGTPAC